ncbi:MAG TPA: histidine phosphatase family protein [Steroidobacteraceae bacterium]|jgi:phosphohistidine phosphatase
MKTLYLVRHAKSDWSDPALSDQQRPLNARGRRNAPAMAARLARRYRPPQLLLSSPALRALRTAQLFARGLGYRRSEIVIHPRLYASTASVLLRVVQALDDKFKRVMLFGHNPELSRLAQRLCDRIDQLPTCAVARFKFDVDSWRDVGHSPPVRTTVTMPTRIARRRR